MNTAAQVAEHLYADLLAQCELESDRFEELAAAADSEWRPWRWRPMVTELEAQLRRYQRAVAQLEAISRYMRLLYTTEWVT